MQATWLANTLRLEKKSWVYLTRVVQLMGIRDAVILRWGNYYRAEEFVWIMNTIEYNGLTLLDVDDDWMRRREQHGKATDEAHSS